MANPLPSGTLEADRAAVIAQYGSDSPAVQAIGLKKKSQHKRPVRRGTRPATQA